MFLFKEDTMAKKSVKRVSTKKGRKIAPKKEVVIFRRRVLVD
jgi:hypothetical protein